MNPINNTLAALALMALLAACGGGGSAGTGTGNDDPVGSDPVSDEPPSELSLSTDGGSIRLLTTPGGFESATVEEVPSTAPADYTYTNGFQALEITGLEPGSSVTVTLEVPAGQNPDDFIQCSHSACVPLDAVVINGNRIEITVSDGDSFDRDLEQDGRITLLGGVGYLVPDADNDGIEDTIDNCPTTSNPDQADADGDGFGDVCDAQDSSDADNDGVIAENDNCPNDANADQADTDDDGIGDACDPQDDTDTDNDGVRDIEDNCPNDANADQADSDSDGIGDACEAPLPLDSDIDGVLDGNDNCPAHPNPDQADTDGDGTGDACDPQDDTDTDTDGVRDEIDNCPADANANQADTDGDGIGDACDPQDDTDTDTDGVRDVIDNCPATANADQADQDSDGTGNACDAEDNRDNDNDGVDNFEDNCPDDANADQADADADGIGDVCEGEPPLETVIRTGDIFAVDGYDPKADLIAAAIAEIEVIESNGLDLLQGMYGDAAIDYRLDRRTGYVSFPSYERTRNDLVTILRQNGGRVQAVAGQYKTELARFSLFGSSPPERFEDGENPSFETPFQRLVAWLLGDDPGNEMSLAGTSNILIARTHDTGKVQDWFESVLPNATVTVCGNDTPLADCTADADLLVVGKASRSAVVDGDVIEIDRLLRASVPMLYLHGSLEHATAGSNAISALFGATFPSAGNFFANETARNAVWGDVDDMIAETRGDNDATALTLGHIDAGDFSYDFAGALDGNTVDRDAVPGFDDEFGRAANTVRSLMNTLDDRQFDIFREAVDDFRLERILALVGDRLRQDVVFPLDIIESDQNDFLSSYFADHLVYGYRQINPLQPDRGFHGQRTQSGVTPGSHAITINTRFTGRKPTGAYALPGKPFSVTRTDDNADVDVEIYWNLQSPGGTFEFRTGDRYDMPKYLRSREINIEPGETITASSPYGGVIQIRHDRGSNDSQNVELDFSGVGQHPFYDGPGTAAAFDAGLAAGIYDWAEIATPETYVTEPLDRMVGTMQAMADNLGWDIDEVARVGTDYYYNQMLQLSGYIGFDAPAQSAEVSSFCSMNGWECDNPDYHGNGLGGNGRVEGNIRQSITNCGSFGGCSNQPVTYTWNWNPLGAGPVHERGHHLEGNSSADYHRFAPFQVHQLTNTWRAYLPYVYYLETGNIGACGVERNEHRSNGTRFQILQDAHNSADVEQHMADNVWNAGQSRAMNRAMITQLAAHAADQGRFTTGWDYLPLLLRAAREFRNKLNEGEASFDAAKSRYGFGMYTHAEAQEVVATRDAQRSWALIAYSVITGRDQRPYWDMLGWSYTAKASQQVASLVLLPAEPQFYAFDDVCSIEDAIAVPVDGTTEWPENRPTVFTTAAQKASASQFKAGSSDDDAGIVACGEHGLNHVH